jgi:hypothetical protein
MDACVREWAANNLAPEAAIAQEQDSVDGDITEKKGATPKARRAILIAVNEPVIDHPAEYKKPALSEPAIQT